MSGSSNDGYAGLADITDAGSQQNAQTSLVRRLLTEVHTAQLVKVIAVSIPIQPDKPGTVDVQPMVNQIDGAGKPMAHGTIYSLPYFRLQGGTNAIIIDPAVGDIGLSVTAERDITKVKNTGAIANPDTRRRHSMADGLYLGGFLNAVPAQYILFGPAGIVILSPTKVRIQAPTTEVVSDHVTITSNDVAITGTSLTHNGKNVGSTHTHGGVQTGGGTTGAPT